MISERINTGYGNITLRCGYSQRQIFLYLEQFLDLVQYFKAERSGMNVDQLFGNCIGR